MLAVSNRLGNPERTFRSVHIAGTNGKGSVSLKIAKTLEHANYRCGLFTSPHISNFRERIKIGNELISEEDTADYLEKIMEISQKEKIPLTYFEYCTLLAFQYFAKRKVDLAVIEVGLGGRLDATNIITPLLSVITSISKDHTEMLGNTDEEIAKEKAEIIKPFTPVVIGPRLPAQIFKDKATSVNAFLTQVTEETTHFGVENQLIAQRAISLLQNQLDLPLEAITRSLQIEPPCRFEVVSKKTLQQASLPSEGTIILDVAHNPDGIMRLIQRLELTYPQKKLHFGVNFSADKDVVNCLNLIFPVAKTIHILEVNHPKLISKSRMKELCFSLKNPTNMGTPSAIFQDFLPTMTDQDVLVICGSFFIMKTVRAHLGYKE
jgi:dihydrofolate synthase/folylpolyglutamate synthase